MHWSFPLCFLFLYSERISLSQEMMNVHLCFLQFFPRSFNDFRCSEKNCRKSEQLIPGLDWLPNSISTLLPFLKCSSWGEDRTQYHFVGLLGAAHHFASRTFIPHIISRSLLPQRLPAWLKMISLLLWMRAVGLSSVCTWTTFLSSPDFSKEYV